MARKKSVVEEISKKTIKKGNVIEEVKDNVHEGAEDVGEVVEEVQGYIRERRKFFKKLFKVVLFILFLLMIAYLLS